MKKIPFAVLGCGTVGNEVARQFLKNKEQFPLNSFSMTVVCELNLHKMQEIPEQLFTSDSNTVLDHPEIQVVIELIGGTDKAKEFILRAISNKKHVITANKAVLAEYGKEIFDAAQKNNVMVRFEAAVAGGIPIIRLLQKTFIVDDIISVKGILNGTTNYILTRMREYGEDMADSLKKAQQLGFAEADPTSDITGKDSAHKLALLVTTIEGVYPPFDSISYIGINNISIEDIIISEKLGYSIKLLASYERFKTPTVMPVFISHTNPLSNINFEINALLIKSQNLGEVFISGRGAGGAPTAVSVLSDLVQLKNDIEHHNHQGELLDFQPNNDSETHKCYCLYKEDNDALLENIEITVPLRKKQYIQTPKGNYFTIITEKITDKELLVLKEKLIDFKCYKIEE